MRRITLSASLLVLVLLTGCAVDETSASLQNQTKTETPQGQQIEPMSTEENKEVKVPKESSSEPTPATSDSPPSTTKDIPNPNPKREATVKQPQPSTQTKQSSQVNQAPFAVVNISTPANNSVVAWSTQGVKISWSTKAQGPMLYNLFLKDKATGKDILIPSLSINDSNLENSHSHVVGLSNFKPGQSYVFILKTLEISKPFRAITTEANFTMAK